MPECSDPPPPRLLVAIAQFNRGEYFTCHETLEALWLAERGPVRQLYQGILQVGVGLLHRERGNYAGAVGVLANGLARLGPFPAVCLGVDVAGLRQAAERCHQELLRLGPGRLTEFDAALIPRIRLVGARSSESADG